MIMILVLHTRFDGIESVYDSKLCIPSFTKIVFESFSIIGVNLFILISGFFGIHLKTKSIYNLFSQIYFFAIIGVLGYVVIGGTEIPFHRLLIKALFPIENTIWFIPSYFMLMVMSPLLNVFIECKDIKTLAKYTLGLYVLSFYWTTVWNSVEGFGGYSWGWFIILYLTGHLIRFYTNEHCIKQSLTVVIWLSSTLLLILIAILQYPYPIGRSLVWSYNNPIIYLSSISFFILFVNLKIGHNRIINFIAKSSFGALLFHVSSCSYYPNICKWAYENFDGIGCIFITSIIVVGYYLIAVFIDQLRIFLFNNISKKFIIKSQIKGK